MLSVLETDKPILIGGGTDGASVNIREQNGMNYKSICLGLVLLPAKMPYQVIYLVVQTELI